jgi:hypothetical protein
MQPDLCCHRFEPDMLAFSGCYYGGGEKEKKDLGAIRRRWKTLHVRPNYSPLEFLQAKPHLPCFRDKNENLILNI